MVGGKDSILSLRFSFYFSSLGYAGSFFSYLGGLDSSTKTGFKDFWQNLTLPKISRYLVELYSF